MAYTPNIAISGISWNNASWFFTPWVLNTWPGTVSAATNGAAAPTLSGNGWAGTNLVGLVFQTYQYNTTWRAF